MSKDSESFLTDVNNDEDRNGIVWSLTNTL